jgi:hypothetical protein
MSNNAVYRRTSKGEEVINKRTLNLPVKLRSLLIMVNGKKSGMELGQDCAQLGDIAVMLAELIRQGCIEQAPAVKVTPEPARHATHGLNVKAKQFMTSYLYGKLGPESETMVHRIEKCKNNSDLSRLLDDCRAILRSVGKAADAEEFWNTGRGMLA